MEDTPAVEVAADKRFSDLLTRLKEILAPYDETKVGCGIWKRGAVEILRTIEFKMLESLREEVVTLMEEKLCVPVIPREIGNDNEWTSVFGTGDDMTIFSGNLWKIWDVWPTEFFLIAPLYDAPHVEPKSPYFITGIDTGGLVEGLPLPEARQKLANLGREPLTLHEIDWLLTCHPKFLLLGKCFLLNETTEGQSHLVSVCKFEDESPKSTPIEGKCEVRLRLLSRLEASAVQNMGMFSCETRVLCTGTVFDSLYKGGYVLSDKYYRFEAFETMNYPF